jgi:hypothetical protein
VTFEIWAELGALWIPEAPDIFTKVGLETHYCGRQLLSVLDRLMSRLQPACRVELRISIALISALRKWPTGCPRRAEHSAAE